MKQWGLVAVIVGLMGFIGVSCWLQGKDDEKTKQQRVEYQRITDSLRTHLTPVLARTDTLRRRIPIERQRVEQDEAKVITADKAVAAADSSGDSLRMIRTRDSTIASRDTLIVSQRQSITTLTALGVSQGSTIQLYQTQRGIDSLRIHTLDKKARGLRFLGLKLPGVRCGPMAGLAVMPKLQPTLGIGCTLGY